MQTEPSSSWAARLADSVIARRPLLSVDWRYETGVVLKGMELLWRKTGEVRYWQYVQANMDSFVQPDGSIRTYRVEEYNIDQINMGRMLFPLLDATGDARYRKAAFCVRDQLRSHPRTSEGGFWHKQIYPHQLWLDGVYMAGPFLAEFGVRFDEPQAFGEVADEILLVERHTRDEATGLLYHAWDESRQQPWCDPQTGRSPHFWGRAVGWYLIALVDVLDHFPAAHPRRADVLAVLQRLAPAVVRVQDQASGVWYQILDLPDRQKNYLEASASCMFAYGLAKAARLGYLGPEYRAAAEKAYAGIVKTFVSVDEEGHTNLNGICSVAGLGGTPYRDGSFEYYMSEKVVANDSKGVGAFLMAAVELE
ncbi:MAG: glycoside hydrolase family 88/105 protein [Chloroflexota bacterium]